MQNTIDAFSDSLELVLRGSFPNEDVLSDSPARIKRKCDLEKAASLNARSRQKNHLWVESSGVMHRLSVIISSCGYSEVRLSCGTTLPIKAIGAVEF